MVKNGQELEIEVTMNYRGKNESNKDGYQTDKIGNSGLMFPRFDQVPLTFCGNSVTLYKKLIVEIAFYIVRHDC